LADVPSNAVYWEPDRDPVDRPLVPAPSGGDSDSSVGESILSVLRTGIAFAGSVAAAIPTPTLEALIHRSERGTPATFNPQIRASNAAQASIAIAPPASLQAGVLTPITSTALLLYAAIAYATWRAFR
jgi:hypothetical protein